MNYLIEANNLVKTYMLGKTKVEALRNVSLKVKEGEQLMLGGPSGSGKSTLLHILGCLDRPTSGMVTMFNKNIFTSDDNQLSDFRANNIGFVFQNFNLVPVLNAYENVEYPLLLCKKQNRRDRVMSILKEVGLEEYAKHYPNELSGGQRQRVAIARAMVTEGKLLIADEPTANLDSTTGSRITELMFSLTEKKGTTLIICTHNEQLLNSGTRTIFLTDGKVSQMEKVEVFA